MRIIQLLLALCLSAYAAPARADGETKLLVFAAASTRDAVTEVLAAYGTEHGVEAVGVFAASATLAHQIAQGAPADIYISANAAWMDTLQRDALIVPSSRVDLLANELVLIVPSDRDPEHKIADSWQGLASLDAILTGGRLALADPQVAPAGAYARQALERAGLWEAAAASAIYAPDVRAALAWVDRGEAAAAMVYATDAKLSERVSIIAAIPEDAHDPIRYPAAIVAGAHEPQSQALLAYLVSPEATAIFVRHGFIKPGFGS